MTRLLPVLLLMACETDGVLYGGGDGLTLTFEREGAEPATLHWEGAAKSDLKEVNGGIFDDETTWDPVALVADNGTWAVRADAAFDGPTHLDALGFDCFGAIGTSFTAFANEASYGFSAGFETLEGGASTVQVAGVFAEGDSATVLDGSGSAPAQWGGDLDACPHGDLATTVSVAWAFDEKVTVKNQCLECNLPTFELPDGSFDVDLTF